MVVQVTDSSSPMTAINEQDFKFAAPSYWEKSIDLSPKKSLSSQNKALLARQDFVIVGGGIVGLSTALGIRKLCPHAEITLLERGAIPTGATTKNAGFGCFGSLTELMKHVRAEGEESMLKLVKMRFDGLNLLRENIPPEEMDYKNSGGYEIFTSDQRDLWEESRSYMDRINLLLKKEIGIDNVFSDKSKEIGKFGFNRVEHLLWNSGEGEMNSGKLVRALIRKLEKENINIINDFELNNYTRFGNTYLLKSVDGQSISTNKAVFATNAFTPALLPELQNEHRPGRGQVLVTKPIQNLKINGCFHLNEGYFYFREIEGRVLFGGGRNLNFEGETTAQFGLTDQIQNELERLLNEVILPGTPHEIDYRWSGIMCFGPKIDPIIEEVRPDLFAVSRMSGMGVAIGSLAGALAAEMAVNCRQKSLSLPNWDLSI
jgi:gamma-glutamylputrescine oxidase